MIDHSTYSEGYVAVGRYEVKHYIGGGAMGSVYEALDLKVDRRVAIKFLSKELTANPKLLKRFEREAKAAGRIGHDNVCAASDWGLTEQGVPFLVMELLEGEPLSRRLAIKDTIPVAEAIPIMFQVLSALGVAHAEGIVHRDLKPDNIFLALTSDGEERVKIVDFGIAKFLDTAASATADGVVIGTPMYMSPEQVGGHQDEIDQRTDIFAAGVILYEMLTGNSPFTRKTFPEVFAAVLYSEPPPVCEIEPSCPRALSAVIERAMAKQKDARYSSAAELTAALSEATGIATKVSALPAPSPADSKKGAPARSSTGMGEPETLSASETTGVQPRWSWKWAALTVTVALVVGGGVVGVMMMRSPGDDPSPSREPPPSEEPAAAVEQHPPVEIRLAGLPEGARAVFDGEAVPDGLIAGATGHQGVLEVEAAGYQSLRLELTLDRNREVDLREHLRPEAATVEVHADSGATPASAELLRAPGSQPERPHGRRDHARVTPTSNYQTTKLPATPLGSSSLGRGTKLP